MLFLMSLSLVLMLRLMNSVLIMWLFVLVIGLYCVMYGWLNSFVRFV